MVAQSILPTVLVVEDQAFQRYMTMDMIAESGFSVIGAANADQAIAILRNRPDITLVFSDIDMPGSMDGLAMTRYLRETSRDIRFVLTSGRAPRFVEPMDAHEAFLPKPYLFEDVTRVLRRMNDGVMKAA